MTTLATFKPASADLVVRDPITRLPLPAEGEVKPLDTYWSRRLVDGDVVMVLPNQATIEAAPARPGKATLKPV